jgi:hypothetical protein
MRGRVLVALITAASAFAGGAVSAHAECAYSGVAAGCEGEAGQPVTALRAVVNAHHGSSYKRPGYTTLELVSTPEAAYMTASERRTKTHLRWLTEESDTNAIEVPWECKHLRQAFRYTLTARGQVGETVTTTIVFHAQLSAHWCAAAKAREEAQRAAAKRKHETELREAAQREANQRAAERRETEHRETEHRETEHREAEHREAASTCTNGTYVNSAGNTVCKPEESSTGPPAGATAECEDGTYSFSESRSGTCSSHGGVVRWL